MWWKLAALTIVTLVAVLSVIPIRTHAVAFDPANPPARISFGAMLANMYLTPGTAALIAAICIVAVLIGLRVVRG